MGNHSIRTRKRVLHKGPNEGICVICGERGKLSQDHVPPKKCNNLNDVELNTLTPDKDYSRIGTTSQGGTHFKTLCKKCNSEKLGLEYDPALIDFSNAVTDLALGAKRKNIHLPPFIFPIIKPQRIARSIVGHVLAAVAIEETSGLISNPLSDAMRRYFLDDSSPLPKELDIYYWLYPSKKQVVIKYFSKAIWGHKPTVTGHVIKFLPFGFWLVWNKPESFRFNVSKLVKDKGMAIDDTDQIIMDLYNRPSTLFPEVPEDMEINFLNNNHAFIGNPKNS